MFNQNVFKVDVLGYFLYFCVRQTSITLMWTLYELARHPDLQEEIRAEISAARIASKGDVMQMLKMVPLLKGALKETLRYTNSSQDIMA